MKYDAFSCWYMFNLVAITISCPLFSFICAIQIFEYIVSDKFLSKRYALGARRKTAVKFWSNQEFYMHIHYPTMYYVHNFFFLNLKNLRKNWLQNAEKKTHLVFSKCLSLFLSFLKVTKILHFYECNIHIKHQHYFVVEIFSSVHLSTMLVWWFFNENEFSYGTFSERNALTVASIHLPDGMELAM